MSTGFHVQAKARKEQRKEHEQMCIGDSICD